MIKIYLIIKSNSGEFDQFTILLASTIFGIMRFVVLLPTFLSVTKYGIEI